MICAEGQNTARPQAVSSIPVDQNHMTLAETPNSVMDSCSSTTTANSATELSVPNCLSNPITTSTGPCQSGQWLEFSATAGRAVCRQSPCPVPSPSGGEANRVPRARLLDLPPPHTTVYWQVTDR